MGSVYDQEQTRDIKVIREQSQNASKLNKWILGIALATFVGVIIQIIIAIIKK